MSSVAQERRIFRNPGIHQPFYTWEQNGPRHLALDVQTFRQRHTLEREAPAFSLLKYFARESIPYIQEAEEVMEQHIGSENMKVRTFYEMSYRRDPRAKLAAPVTQVQYAEHVVGRHLLSMAAVIPALVRSAFDGEIDTYRLYKEYREIKTGTRVPDWVEYEDGTMEPRLAASYNDMLRTGGLRSFLTYAFYQDPETKKFPNLPPSITDFLRATHASRQYISEEGLPMLFDALADVIPYMNWGVTTVSSRRGSSPAIQLADSVLAEPIPDAIERSRARSVADEARRLSDLYFWVDQLLHKPLPDNCR